MQKRFGSPISFFVVDSNLNSWDYWRVDNHSKMTLKESVELEYCNWFHLAIYAWITNYFYMKSMQRNVTFNLIKIILYRSTYKVSIIPLLIIERHFHSLLNMFHTDILQKQNMLHTHLLKKWKKSWWHHQNHRRLWLPRV